MPWYDPNPLKEKNTNETNPSSILQISTNPSSGAYGRLMRQTKTLLPPAVPPRRNLSICPGFKRHHISPGNVPTATAVKQR